MLLYLLVAFIYSMIVMENDIVCGFTFTGKEGFDGHPKFLSAFNIFGV